MMFFQKLKNMYGKKSLTEISAMAKPQNENNWSFFKEIFEFSTDYFVVLCALQMFLVCVNIKSQVAALSYLVNV